jgi:hypothetical protein
MPSAIRRRRIEFNFRLKLSVRELRWISFKRPTARTAAYPERSPHKLYRGAGKRQEAQENRTTATGMYPEMGMTYWLEKAEA